MASSEQEQSPSEIPQHGDRVVISGISGIYPQARSVKELSHILYNKVDPITKADWAFKHPEVTSYLGKNPDLNRFDAQFFMVHYRLSESMDPMSRKILEQTYQAIYDAGFSPDHLKEKKVAVYIASALSETEGGGFYERILKSSFEILGCGKTMFANRISYWLNTKGPSVYMDGSCDGGLVALEQAYMDLVSGRCEAAIVGTSHMTFLGHYSVHYGRHTQMSRDGKTKSFDQDADGFALSDATVVLFLQKKKDALRIYGELVNVKSEYTKKQLTDTTHKFNFCQNPARTVKFLENFYKNIQVSPNDVEYVEAFGCATPDADRLELEMIDQIFCKNRSSPLLVGSVMSNVGYTEASTGLTAITKVLLGYHSGIIAGNLHCNKPRQDVKAVRDGRITILTDHASFNRTYTAVNLHSFTGSSSHALLCGYYKPRSSDTNHSDVPYLVTISNRTENGVQKIIDDIKSRPLNPEEFALLHNIHSRNINGHLGRGYTILHTKEEKTVSLREKAEYFDNAKPPLWFVYSGMGSQWNGMGTQLMRIPIFAAAIECCHRILAPKGLDIVHIITSSDKTIFNNILNSFVGIAAIQIGLTDILKHLGLVPDNIIGHSVGELGCAYADGCLTAEEMILSAYSRGKASIETKFVKGSMSAVGLGYQQMRDLCPPEIDVACHNGPDSCTISGPVDIINEFIAKLNGMDIFAKEVPCSNIAYHSRYIAQAGPTLQKYLLDVIKRPRPRSEKWLSTSVPQDRWNEFEAKYCSAEYHTNNLLRPVLFEETSRMIPANAVLVEVAPHGLLQPILKRSLPASCVHVALTKRGYSDNVLLLLDAVGKLYMEGYTPNVQALYPKVEFPVSTGTPMLSHLVEWSHTEDWHVPSCVATDMRRAAACNFLISIHDDEHSFIKGNIIGGKVLYPFSASLIAAWDTLSMSLGVPKKSRSVVFSDVHLHAEPVLLDQRLLELRVALNRGSGWFEISNEISKIASGYIAMYGKNINGNSDLINNIEMKKYEHKMEEIYDVFKGRDYFYSGDFCSIHSVNSSLTKAYVNWNDNWATQIDGLLQLNALARIHDGVSQPVYVQKLVIDINKHNNQALNIDQIRVMNAEVCDTRKITRCGGITLRNIRFRDVPCLNEFKFKLLVPTLDGHAKEIDDGNISEKNMTYMDHMSLQSSIIGDLNSLQWAMSASPFGPGVKVTVHYAGINIKDIIKATGTGAQDFAENSYGMDFSGTTKSRCRVMGVVPGGACSSEVRAPPELLWPVPEHWTLEDAATVPLAYLNAFYCFLHNETGATLMKKTEKSSLLVHGGAGALGQAAISIGLELGYEVFTTVSDVAKKRFLLKLYPKLKEENIGNSRDHSFGDTVLNGTDGNGCYMIINNVREDLKNVSLRCSSICGHTYDMSQLIHQEDYKFPMSNLTMDRSYVSLDLSSVIRKWDSTDMEILHAMLSEGISRGYVRPLSRLTFAPHDAPRAFRLLAASAHRGRVLLHLRDHNVSVLPRMTCSAHSCNILICDGSALNIHLANRLIRRGAKTLYIYTLNSALISEINIRFWKNIGVHVEVTSSGKLNNREAVLKLLHRANRLGFIEGIYFVVTDNTDSIANEELTDLVANIEEAAKSMNQIAKHIRVLTFGGTVESRAHVARDNDPKNIPITYLNIRLPKTGIPNTKLGSWCKGVIDTLERAVHHRHSVLTAKPLQVKQTPFLEDLVSLSNIQFSEEYREDLSLREMGLQGAEAKVIGNHLLYVYNASLSEDQIFCLDKQKICHLESVLKDRTFKQVNGLAKFFPLIEQDELSASADTMILPTKARPIVTDTDDLDAIMSYLCIIPGLDGISGRFRGLCERLKLPAMVLQPGFNKPYETIEDSAKRFAKILIEKIGVKSHFYLLGYEVGILIAFKIAAIIESYGFKGTIFCIGCAPEDVTSIVKKEMKNYQTESEFQDAIIRHMFTLMTNADIGILHKALRDKTTWSDKVEACVKCLRGNITHTLQYAQAIIESAYERLIEAYCYNFTSEALRSRVIIMSSPDIVSSVDNNKFQSVDVHELKAPFSSALEDMRCASIINRYLSPDILEEYEKKNWCEKYYEDYRARLTDD